MCYLSLLLLFLDLTEEILVSADKNQKVTIASWVCEKKQKTEEHISLNPIRDHYHCDTGAICHEDENLEIKRQTGFCEIIYIRKE